MKQPTPANRCFVVQLELSLAEKLRADLASQGFQFTTPPHTIFAARKEGISCTLYSSGKFTVQGKEATPFIEFYLEPEILKRFDLLHPTVDTTDRIGVDEAGKGDFFGSLCIAGVYATEPQIKQLIEWGVRDSKSFSDRSIHQWTGKLKKALIHHIVRIDPKRYNEIYPQFPNLNHLLGWGHATVIAQLHTTTQCNHAIIDQFAAKHVVANALKKKNIEISLTQQHRAESDPIVAAASILARGAFLESLQRLSKEWDMPFPKGASKQCIAFGKAFVSRYGQEALSSVSKMHFKTYSAITNAGPNFMEEEI